MDASQQEEWLLVRPVVGGVPQLANIICDYLRDNPLNKLAMVPGPIDDVERNRQENDATWQAQELYWKIAEKQQEDADESNNPQRKIIVIDGVVLLENAQILHAKGFKIRLYVTDDYTICTEVSWPVSH
jgi:hypothetical protein